MSNPICGSKREGEVGAMKCGRRRLVAVILAMAIGLLPGCINLTSGAALSGNPFVQWQELEKIDLTPLARQFAALIAGQVTTTTPAGVSGQLPGTGTSGGTVGGP